MSAVGSAAADSPARRVLLNDFRRQWREIGAEVHEAVENVGGSGAYILGQAVRDFEQSLADLIGLPWCIGVGNGHDALEIALRSLGLEPGQRVVTTPLSAFATAQAIVRAGGCPVFVDVADDGLLDLERCEAAIASDPELRFLLPVHLWGRAADLDHIERLRETYGVTVVEDCAQSIGAGWNGRRTGTAGNAAAFSFYPTKNLGALGDAGAVVTSSETVCERARCLRNYGQSERRFEHQAIGLNSRLDEIHAAVLRTVLMPRLPGWTDRRREAARQYTARIRHPLITIPPIDRRSDPVWHLFPIRVSRGRREEFRAHMEDRGIDTTVHYPHLIPDQPAFGGRAGVTVIGPLDNALSFVHEEVSLPIHAFLTGAEIDLVIESCNGWKP